MTSLQRVAIVKGRGVRSGEEVVGIEAEVGAKVLRRNEEEEVEKHHCHKRRKQQKKKRQKKKRSQRSLRSEQ
jgi:hypothetical protein